MKTLKVRIEPNSSQRKVIDHMIDANCLVYNGLLVACKQVFAKERKLPSVFDLNKVATRMRHNSPYVAEAHSMTLNETAKRVHNAFKKTLGTHKKEFGELLLETYEFVMAGDHFPRFKPKGQFNSFTYPSARDYSIEHVKKNGKKRRMLRLGKVPGLLRCYNQDTVIEGKLKTCTIKRKNLGSLFEYYACIVIEDEPKQHPESTNGPVGVDIGVLNIAALSDGTVFPNDRIFTKLSKRLAKLQRQLSRALFGSEHYKKLQTGINHLYEKINNHRKNNTENISAYIVKNHDIIGMEDL
ncbi:MAG: transposase, partial [Candidatus Methanomethylophilus sp.]|nr:transposase [Methanomethylophilus sp.]